MCHGYGLGPQTLDALHRTTFMVLRGHDSTDCQAVDCAWKHLIKRADMLAGETTLTYLRNSERGLNCSNISELKEVRKRAFGR